MRTIENLINETTRTSLTFNEINPSTTDFTGYKFLNKPFCTLLMKQGDHNYIILFDCEDSSNMCSISNGVYKVTVDEDYVYDIEEMKTSTVIEF
jgi:hypothetical protein